MIVRVIPSGNLQETGGKRASECSLKKASPQLGMPFINFFLVFLCNSILLILNPPFRSMGRCLCIAGEFTMDSAPITGTATSTREAYS